MSDRMRLPMPTLSAERARDIGRGHMALAEQYRLGEQHDVADEHERMARLWFEYARTLVAVGSKEAS